MTALFVGIVVGFLLWVAFQLGKAKGRTEMVETAFGAGWRAHQFAGELQSELEEDALEGLAYLDHLEAQRRAGREGTQ